MRSSISVGDAESYTKCFSETEVHSFADLTGDYNSIHIDSEEAKRSIFRDRVVHGMLVGSLISTVIGTKMPGEGSIYIEQQLVFRKPVYFGDVCTANVKIIDIINPEKGIIKLETVVFNQKGELVIDGYAVVKVPTSMLNQ